MQGDKMRSFHSQLRAILRELVKTQREGGFDHTLRYKGQCYDLHFKIPVAFVVGDCAGHNKLCGRYGSHRGDIYRLCRDCDCSPEDSDNPNIKCKRTKQATIQALVDQEDYEGLHQMSQHYVKNAFHDVCFGGDPYGIYGSTPVEVLHSIQLGL